MMILHPRLLLSIAVSLIFLISLTWLSGCPYGDGTFVTFENRTGEAIRIYKDGRLLSSFAPGETARIGETQHVWAEHLSARDEADKLIWQADITWDELKQMGYLVVIESAVPTATPQSTPGGT